MKLQGNNGCFKRNILWTFLWFSITCFAQEESQIPLTYQSVLFGIGKAKIYDSYLSPLKYTGNSIGLIYEEVRRTKLLNKRIFSQHFFQLEASDTRNPTETALDYTGMLNYDYGLFYRFKPVQKVRFFAGFQADGLLGFIYSSRNGNNFGSLKAHLNLNLSGMAAYTFRIKKQPIRLRYQLNIPVAGVLFAPHFGQSYYEIGLGEYDDLLHFASLQNQWILRSLLSVELPFKVCTVRLAYLNNFYETRLNQLGTHLSSGTFYIGLSKQFFVVPERKSNKKYVPVFE